MAAQLVLAMWKVGVVAAAESPNWTYRTQTIEGWTVHIDERLFGNPRYDLDQFLPLFTAQLQTIVKVVPEQAVAALRKVPLWVSPVYPGVQQRAEYHPNGQWLREHGRNPAMAKGVEITNIPIFEREVKRMPVLVLHELAHAYHDRVLGFDNAEIKTAYQHAVAGKSYDAVERHDGRGHTSVERAYAMTNEREYFAECSEAFFGENDFYPFNREQLAKHDPAMFKLLPKLWGATP